MSAAGPPARDPGVQLERTDLAWARTAAAMVVVGTIGLRFGAVLGGGIAFMPGLLFLALGTLLLSEAGRSRFGIRDDGPSAALPLMLVGAVAASFGLISVLLITARA